MSEPVRGKTPILPPFYFLLSLGLMIALDRVAPGPRLAGPLFDSAGLLLAALGLGIMLWAAGLFRRAGTTIKPFQESTTLVVTGPYRLTRNPMYLGMVTILLGVGLLLGSASPLIVIPVFVVILEQRFIRVEEAALECKFGAAYSTFKARTRRWI